MPFIFLSDTVEKTDNMARTTMNACAQRTVAGRAPAPRVGGARVAARKTFSTAHVAAPQRAATSARGEAVKVQAGIRDGQKLDRKLRVAVIGGGPAGACTAETLSEGGVETVFIERKMDNCKVRQSPGCSICCVWAPRLRTALNCHDVSQALEIHLYC